ncbi:transposase family protein [Streptomyces sp. NPDC003753]
MTNTSKPPEGAGSLVYQCRLPLFTNTVNYVADLLHAHLKAIGSRWRSRSAGQIAVLLLAVLRHDQRAADLAGGNDISATTIRRWCDEVIALLAAKAPRLNRGLKKISRGGGEVVLLNGTPIRTRRRTGKANRKNYSGKHKSHGLMFLALTDERGNLAWISSARRGAASEVKTARHDKICEHLRIAGLGALADLGFVGLDQDPNDPVITTGAKRTRKKKLTTAQKQNNQLIAAARAPVEHGFAALKNWRILTRLRLDPARATNLLRALLVLTNLETSR